MPNCKKCSKVFPYQLKIGDKYRNLQNRKYCLDCSPFGLHNTKQIEKISLNLDNESICFCQLCNKKYIYVRNKGSTLSLCFCCITKKRRLERKKKAIEYKGGKCSMCGYNKSTKALDFHHRERSQKNFSIASKYTLSWEKVKAELDKCDLLCANCHREIEEEIDRNK